MLASRPDYSIPVIENLRVMGTSTVLSFIGGSGPATGKGRIKTRR
jgi:hypothetical protein